MPRWQGTKKQSGAGRTIGLALVLFVLLCGATLALSGRSGAPSQRAKTRAQVHHALQAVHQASKAMKSMDYGKAKKQMARARVTLEALATTIDK